MESTPHKSIHPLIATAAIALIVLSAVGIGAITGLIPTSKSKPEQIVAPAAQPPVAPVTTNSPSAPQPAAAQPQIAKSPAPAPAKPVAQRPVVQSTTAPSREPVEETRYPREPVRVAAAERSTPAPRPICIDCGTVESVREVKQAGEGSGIGAVAGGVAGAVVGRQIGGGRGRDLATVAGAVGGAVAGHQVEKHVKSSVLYEISVRMEDGSVRTITESSPPTWRAGDKVRIQGDKLTTQS